jgi:NADH-quinone oxidoreductase subunit M
MPGAFVLPLLLALPILGAIWVMLTPRDERGLHMGFGFVFAIATFGLSLVILKFFNPNFGGFQLLFDKEWIPGLGAHFKVGIDGISLWLVILTTFITPLVILSATRAVEKNTREFIAAILVLEAGMLGAFVALDLFLFYVAWEVMLIPMYLLIGIWGGQRRIYASIKFVIYTMVGSLLMLVAIFYLYAQHGAITGTYTTDFIALNEGIYMGKEAQIWCFLAFAMAFAIKIPLFPLHTWLPDAHVEAPTAGSVILAGVMLKFGIYGFLRFAMPLFPYGAAVCAPYIAILAVIGIIYGAIVAFAQDDVKKLVAYSSVSHLGFCALGVFALTSQGIEGSIFAMLSHGLTTGGLFLGIGVLYERRHTRRMAEYGGIWKVMPVFSALFLIITLGSAGLPGLSGFIGEFLTLFGTWLAGPDTFPDGWPNYLPVPKILAALAATGVILGAVYLLYMFQKVFFGPITREENKHLKDLSGRELAVFLPIIAGIFFMGIYPQPFLRTMAPSVRDFTLTYERKLSQTEDFERANAPTPVAASPADQAPEAAARADAERRVRPNTRAAGERGVVIEPAVIERIAGQEGGGQ